MDMEQPDLPTGWSQHFDDNYQAYYFYNEFTGVTQWEYPQVEQSYYCHGNPVAEFDNVGTEQMPSHMLASSSIKYTLSGASVPNLALDYSDMEDDGNDENATMPIFDIPEQRDDLMNRRSDHQLLIGGSSQDYLNMARLYKLERPYSDPNFHAICVLCRKSLATHVLFPCQHRCICESCLINEEICEDAKLASKPHGFCNCPLCGQIIKKIFLSEDGHEVERYWSWVYEIPPVLPRGFMNNFKHSAAVIESVWMNKKHTNDNSGACSIS
jgi:hypothetical protein